MRNVLPAPTRLHAAGSRSSCLFQSRPGMNNAALEPIGSMRGQSCAPLGRRRRAQPEIETASPTRIANQRTVSDALAPWSSAMPAPMTGTESSTNSAMRSADVMAGTGPGSVPAIALGRLTDLGDDRIELDDDAISAAGNVHADGDRRLLAGARSGSRGGRCPRAVPHDPAVFLSTGGSYTATAERLTTHKNTVLYRIGRAEETRDTRSRNSRHAVSAGPRCATPATGCL